MINYRYNEWACEHNIDRISLAYRNNQNGINIYFAGIAFNAIRALQQCFIMVGDFASFFDNSEHNYLKLMLCKLFNVSRLPADYFALFKNITCFASWKWEDILKVSATNHKIRDLRKSINNKARIFTKEQFLEYKKNIKKNKSGIGIPQGSPLSCVLSNVYMIEIDEQIKDYVTSQNGLYMRYSDDFIIILPYTKDEEIINYKQHIYSYFVSIKHLVKLQEEKTSCYIYHDQQIYQDGSKTHLDYLGFLFDGLTKKLRPRAITKYYYRMRRKARTIGMHNWISPKGKRISAKNIYRVYSDNRGTQRNFIGYASAAKKKLKLNDPETNALLLRHKQKIAGDIKKNLPLHKETS